MTHFSLSARGRERDNFDIRVVARETMVRVSEERKRFGACLSATRLACGSLWLYHASYILSGGTFYSEKGFNYLTTMECEIETEMEKICSFNC